MSKKKKDQAAQAMGYKESYQCFVRTMKLLYDRCPGRVVSGLVLAAWEALSPYAGVFFAARVIEELAGDRDPIALRNWVIATLAVAAVIALVTALLTRWKNIHNQTFWCHAVLIPSEEMQRLDYVDQERTEIQDLYNTIWMNHMGPSMGIMAELRGTENLVSGLCGVIGGVALTWGLFAARVTSGGFAFLNSPLALLAVLASMFIIPTLGSVARNHANFIRASRSGDHNLANAESSFYATLGLEPGAAPDVRMFRQDRFAKERMTDKTWIFYSKGPFARLSRGKMGLFYALGEVVSMSFTGVAYLYVCLKALGGAFGVGMVTQYASAITQLAGGVAKIFSNVGYLRMNAVFMQPVFQLLDTPNNMYMGSLTTEKRSDKQYDIEFRNVSFKYPGSDAWALRDVNVKFRVGSRLAVVGRNGSGKSTFIKLLCRLYDPTEGTILLNGIDIKKYNYTDYINIFSVVFQDFSLLSYTLGENVASSSQVDRKRAERCLGDAGFEMKPEKLPKGLDTYLYKDYDGEGVNFSGGEAQKVAIARALYKDSAFIVMDEPTAALDPIAEEEIYSRFGRLITDKTAIYISHRLSSCRFCDEIMVFDRGTVVEVGAHDGLMAKKGKYEELWNAQAQYYNEEERRRLLQ